MEEKITHNKNYSRVIKIVFLATLFAAILVMGVFELFVPEHAIKKNNVQILKGDWYRVYEDGRRENVGPLTSIGKLPCEEFEKMVLEYELPDDFEYGSYFCMRSSMQDVNVFVDGEHRQSYDNKDTRMWTKSSVSGYVFVALDSVDRGKLLRIETVAPDMYTGYYNTTYIGSYDAILKEILKDHGTSLFLELVMVCFSFVVIVVALLVFFIFHLRLKIFWIAVSLLNTSLYLICDSVIRQFVCSNTTILMELLFVFAMLTWIPYMLYMNEYQDNRYRKLYSVISTVLLGVMFVFVPLILTSTISSVKACIFCLPLYLLGFFTIVYGIIRDIHKRYFRKYIYVGLVFLLLIPTQIIQVVYSFSGLLFNPTTIYCVGVSALLIIDVLYEANQIVESEKKSVEADKANASKSNFLANMSHEIRTPINSIMGMNEMILREAENPEIIEYANMIKNSSEFLLGIVNDILDFSKIEAGKMEIIENQYQTTELVSDMISFTKERTITKGLDSKIKVGQNIPSKLYGDWIRVRQIVINILSNACKYTKEGYVDLSFSWITHDEKEGLQFIVSDTGIGMKKEEIDKLFDKFSRMDVKKNIAIEGTGLGMSIVKYLVEAMNGFIHVESEYGVGTTVTVFIPQKVIDANVMGKPDNKHVAKRDKYKTSIEAPEASILVVDDVNMNLMVVKNLLKVTKIQVDLAQSGAECIKKCMARKYDLIYMDHMMPVMDGIETFKEIRNHDELNKDTPVVIMTANAIVGVKEQYLEEGFDFYLSKPVKPDELEETLKKFLPKEKVKDV